MTELDKLIDLLNYVFLQDCLIVPYETTYRISEKLLAIQEKHSKELVLCKDCKHRVLDTIYGDDWCSHPLGLCNEVYETDFCCHGEREIDVVQEDSSQC